MTSENTLPAFVYGQLVDVPQSAACQQVGSAKSWQTVNYEKPTSSSFL